MRAFTGKTAVINVKGVSAGYTQLPIRFSYEDSTTWL